MQELLRQVTAITTLHPLEQPSWYHSTDLSEAYLNRISSVTCPDWRKNTVVRLFPS
jgi:hypothetical protein